MMTSPKPERILIVEDDDLVARLLALRLEKLGYSIVARLSSAEEALARIVELNPDVILMDIVLAGDMDGIEAARQIRQKLDIPLIFLTAHTNRERLDRAFETSPIAYLHKPIKERELELTVELALLRHRSDRQACADRQELEHLVAERTAELTASNRLMQRILDEQKATQSALQHFRSALDYSADSIFLIERASMRFIDVNQTACERLGYSREEMLKMGPHDITPYFNQTMLEQRFDEIINSPPHSGVIETFHQCKTGEVFPVDVRLRATGPEGRSVMVAIARDITERKEHEAAQKNALVREVHHRIKNHLQGIVGLLHQQRRDSGACNLMLEGIIAKISTVATVHGLRGKTLEEGIDLMEMISAISSAVNDLIPSRFAARINSTLDLPTDISRNESVPLALAINELLVNARKFSSGQVDIKLSGDREKTAIHIVNPTSEPVQPIGASGLKLVKALLQTEGMAFSYEHGADCFRAEIILTTPVIRT
ncbi:MAG: response regulator [Sulfuricellaceae bacterium]|nr:response regulator [Sulfuricellaceae bacterium]